MYTHEFKKRVRYAETDKMGYLYYGRYATLYEIGRVEWLRSIGVSYLDLEDVHGIILPVVSVESRFMKPAYYDEELTIISTLSEIPTKMINFYREILNEKGEKIHSGVVKLFFVDVKTNKRVSIPSFIKTAMEKASNQG